MRFLSWRTLGLLMVVTGLVMGAFAARILMKQDSAAETVRTYLQALADGDSATALHLLETPPAAGPLLNDQVLKASTDMAPISDIATKDQSEVDGTVYATYRVGNQTATQVFALAKSDAGWRLKRGTASLTVSKTVGALPVTINGANVPVGKAMDVFPGTYSVASATPVVSLSKADISVKLVDSKNTVSPEVALTEEGQKTVVAAAKKSLANCLASQEITDKACPNVVEQGANVVVDKKTVKWSLKNDPFKDIKFTAATGGSKGVEALLKMDFNLRLNFSDEGDRQAGNQDIKYDNVRCVVDITTDPMKVSWPR